MKQSNSIDSDPYKRILAEYVYGNEDGFDDRFVQGLKNLISFLNTACADENGWITVPAKIPGNLGDWEPCWPWIGPLNKHGYPTAPGAYTFHRELYRYFAWNGPIAPDHQAHHQCENKRCINPSHIIPLTDDEHRAEHGRTDDESWASPNY